jgi:hypothetical protein
LNRSLSLQALRKFSIASIAEFMKLIGIGLLMLTIPSSALAGQIGGVVRPSSQADMARMHVIFFPDFQKNIRDFSQLARKMTELDQSASFDKSTEKLIRKNAKDLEKSTSRILGYLLDGSSSPKPLPIDPSVKSRKQQMDLLIPLFDPIQQALQEIQPRPVLIAAPAHSILLISLQTVSEISHLLSK